MAEVLTQKAAVLVEPGRDPKFEVRQVPRPEPGPNDVLVRLTATSVCGSDYSLAAGEMGPTKSVLGHEGVGRVAALGAHVPSLDPSIKVGDRVGLAWNRDVCGRCAFCQDLSHDGETRCSARLFSGVSADGSFAQYAVAPARYLVRIPSPHLDDLTDEEIAPVMCGGVTAYKAIKTAGVLPGQWVAVSGAAGGVGLFALAFAKAMGYRTIGVDLTADKGRLALGPHGRADHYVALDDLAKAAEKEGKELAPANPFASPAGEAVKALTTNGLGAAAVVVTSGSVHAYQAAFGMLAPFGTLVAVGIPPPHLSVAWHPVTLIANGWRLVGSAVGTRGDILEALEFVKRKEVVPLTKKATLEDFTRGLLTEVGQGKAEGKYVIRLDEEEELPAKTT